jgi:nuclear-control-of-ATPase protein 2
MSSRYILCSLVAAILLLEPVVAKWRFPFKGVKGQNNAAASASCPPDATLEEIVAGICQVADGMAGGRPSGGRRPTKKLSQLLLIWDWKQVKEWPAVQFPIQTAKWAKSVILYQPPVGIVAAWTISRLVTSGRLFRWNRPQKGEDGRVGDASEQALAKKSSRLDRHFGRALDLDKDDLDYQKFGGVERVRRRLMWKALEEASTRVIPSTQEDNPLEDLVGSLLQLMKLSFPPGGSHADYVQQLLQPMAEAELAWMQVNRDIRAAGDPEFARLLEIAMQTAENRALDSMIRLTRDRLVRTSFRLSRTVQHWKKRVQSQSGMWPQVRSFMAGSFEGDRMRLAFAESAYRSEVIRLGRVVNLLLERPEGMGDSYLQMAVQKTYMMGATKPAQQPKKKWKWNKRMPRIPRHLPDISNWSIRFNADGRGKIQVQKYEDALGIEGPGAIEVLLEDSDQREWLAKSKEWSQKARSMLVGIVDETVETSIEARMEYQVQLQKVKATWMVKEYAEGRGNAELVPDDIAHSWNLIFVMIRDLQKVRRVGDGKSVKWKDANVIHWARQWDLLGIPSAALHIILARMVHKRLVPHWPKMKQFLQETFEVTNEIVQTRFWIPIRDLLTELMYRDTSTMLTGISLSDEETSLDYMLRDLDFGDGTPESRHEAIIKATRQYENDMATGLMRHAIGGRLIRLILIQVQQLKVGMLHAADTVDVLLQTNRFNIQLLAIIPAALILTVGTKLFFRSLYTLRHKDLRPIRAVHSEMAGYLNQLESILLLADDQDVTGRRRKADDRPVAALEALSDHELGEFVLNLYDYLVLLDYSSPTPFPSWQCDGIHQSIVEFLGPKGSLSRMGLNDQVRLISQLKRKHDDLAKHL